MLTLCVACDSRDDLLLQHLIARGEAGRDDERNLITLAALLPSQAG
jgi:hypothetical protein